MAIETLRSAQHDDLASLMAGPSGYLNHSMMLDARRRVVGYRMAWHEPAPRGRSGQGERLRSLADYLAEHLNPRRTGWRLGRTSLFFDVSADPSLLAGLQPLPQENVVLCIGPEDFTPEAMPALQFIREHGFGLMLCRAPELPGPSPLRDLLTHFDVGAGDPELLERMARELEEDGLLLRPIITQAVVQAPEPAEAPGEVDEATMHPESMLIVRLMQMLQRNEDVRQIEAALKHDAVLTYRVLRYINSPAIGPGVEIQSLRHAVTMLGYSHLFRWLALLLATSNKASTSPFMTRKAIMRGRAVELMGKGMLTPTDGDNLFVVGMFSLIDELLGVPMDQVLAKVQLAESVQQAILHRRGVYGPFLALAESSEQDPAQTARLAEDLFMSPGQVNGAVLSALVWSQEVGAAESPY